jgi:hypothetical protein
MSWMGRRLSGRDRTSAATRRVRRPPRDLGGLDKPDIGAGTDMAAVITHAMFNVLDATPTTRVKRSGGAGQVRRARRAVRGAIALSHVGNPVWRDVDSTTAAGLEDRESRSGSGRASACKRSTPCN